MKIEIKQTCNNKTNYVLLYNITLQSHKYLFVLNNLVGNICCTCDNKGLGIMEDCQVGWTITYALQCVEKVSTKFSKTTLNRNLKEN